MNHGRLVASVVVAAVAILWLLPAPGYWVFTANAGLILAISTLGLMAVVGWIREVTLAQAGLTGTAVYVCAWAYRPGNGLGWPFLAAAGLGIGVVVVLSVLLSLAAARLSGIYIMVLTLALQVTIERTVFTYSWTAGGMASAIPRPSLLGITLDSDRSYYLFSLGVFGAVLWFLVRLRNSRFGRGLVLVGTDRQVASAVGVSPWRARVFAFVLAGFCAGMAGALTAPLYLTPPSYIGYTTFTSLVYLAVPVLAGFRSLVGVATVAMVFVLVPQALEPYGIPPFLLGAAGLLLGTMAGPGGVSGLVLDRVHAWKRGKPVGATEPEVRSLPELLTLGTEPPGREQERKGALEVLEGYLPQRPAEGEALVARDVSLAFGGLQALRAVSISAPAGQLVGLIGPNGAGKTTLFDIINGLRTPDAGQILLGGEDVTGMKPWERSELGLGRTFQASRLNLDLSVAENLLAGAYPMIPGNLVESVMSMRRARVGMRRAEAAAWAVAELFSIDHYWDEPARLLSFGNRRRVEIGRSLMTGPRVLLLDEPSAGLDPTAAGILFSTIKQLQRDLGLTVLLVEHYVRAVLENCDLIYVLSRGAVVAVGSPGEVANDPDVRSQYLGPDFNANSFTLAERVR